MDLTRFIAIADDPSDAHDQRLRKRVGVVAGYLTIVAPLSLPIQAQGHPLSWPLAIGLSVFSVGNLTMGDSFMAVAGAPVARPDHARAGIGLAIAILEAASAWRAAHGVDLELRVGLASGPLVGGVIGRRRLLFDVWGDTVNTAARMESSGIPGRVQVAAATWEAVRDEYQFSPRGLEVKGLGRMTTYLLDEP